MINELDLPQPLEDAEYKLNIVTRLLRTELMVFELRFLKTCGLARMREDYRDSLPDVTGLNRGDLYKILSQVMTLLLLDSTCA